jgi:ubiquinone/menaquinone biosynthesis C-methylase UbiE
MEVDPGVPPDYFDLVFSIYGLGWTTDMPVTLALVERYLRPGGCFIVSGEHPCTAAWNGMARNTPWRDRTARKVLKSTRLGRAYRS